MLNTPNRRGRQAAPKRLIPRYTDPRALAVGDGQATSGFHIASKGDARGSTLLGRRQKSANIRASLVGAPRFEAAYNVLPDVA